MPDQKRTSKAPLLGILALALVAAIVYSMRATTPATAPGGGLSADKDAVRILCQQGILATLKDPSSAEMPHISKDTDIGLAQEDPSILRVVTYVNAANDLGAMVRTNFQCDCRKVDGRWQIVTLDTF